MCSKVRFSTLWSSLQATVSEDGEDLPLLGQLPDGWKVLQFRALTQDGCRSGIYKGKEFRGKGDKLVNMGEIFANPRIHSIPMDRLALTESERERFGLEVGDLLFARRSLVAEGAGKCSIVLEVSEPTTFESSIIRARPDKSKANSLFLFYVFQSEFGKHSLDTIRRQTAVAGITGRELETLRLPVPPLAEQHAVARILATLDDKIDLNHRMNQTLEQIAQALFKSWFIDFDPVRAKAEGRWMQGESLPGMPADTWDLWPSEFEDAEIGELPKGWRVGTLGELATITMGQSPPGETYNEAGEGTPFYQGVRDFGTRFPTRRVHCTAPKRFAEKGCILLSVRAPIGRINVAAERCAIGRGLCSVNPSPDVVNYVFYFLRTHHEAWEELEGKGTVFGAATRADVEKLPVLAPSAGLARYFCETVGPFDSRYALCDYESYDLALIRDALLPKLLSGQIRVPISEGST